MSIWNIWSLKTLKQGNADAFFKITWHKKSASIFFRGGSAKPKVQQTYLNVRKLQTRCEWSI